MKKMSRKQTLPNKTRNRASTLILRTRLKRSKILYRPKRMTEA